MSPGFVRPSEVAGTPGVVEYAMAAVLVVLTVAAVVGLMGHDMANLLEWVAAALFAS